MLRATWTADNHGPYFRGTLTTLDGARAGLAVTRQMALVGLFRQIPRPIRTLLSDWVELRAELAELAVLLQGTVLAQVGPDHLGRTKFTVDAGSGNVIELYLAVPVPAPAEDK